MSKICLDRLTQDTDWTDIPNPPYTAGALIKGARGTLLTTFHVPGGKGPHPMILFCHGMPGTERLVEFGAALRQAGFLTVHFHYSGAWGSDGDFSLDHCLEDANTVLDAFLTQYTELADPDNVFAVGHSMGGLIATQITALRKEVKAGAVIVPASYGYKYRLAKTDPQAEAAYIRSYDAYGLWLRGFGWESVKREVSRDPDSYDLEHYAPVLAKKPFLAIAAAMDKDVPREQNVDKLIDAIRSIPENKLSVCTLATDHSLSDQRNLLKKTIGEFFAASVE